MSTHFRVSVLFAAFAGFALSAGIAGQQPATPSTSRAAAPPQPAAIAASTVKPVTTTYKLKTPDGQPDLQGFWTNATLTPLQRPDGVTAEIVSKEQFEQCVAQRAAMDEEQTTPGTEADVHYDFTQFALDKSQSPIAQIYRTSLIIDPPDGKIPSIRPPAAGRGGRPCLTGASAAPRGGGGANAGAGAPRGGGAGAAAGGGTRGGGGAGGAARAGGDGGAAAAIGGGGGGGGRAGQYDRVQNLPVGTRCIIMGGSGPPLMDAGYNANYQIVQGAGAVMILTEMIHDARIIPLDNRPAPPGGYTGWMGSSRGRWQGDTLVVETTNFNGRRLFNGSGPQMKLTERFVRTGADQINYRFTVEDPTVFTRPWTAEEILQKTEGPIFEHACHEGNYGVANTLAGVRLAEKQAAEEAAKKGTK